MNGSYGRAATGLTNDASFAANAGAAKAGADGEVKTAAILDGFSLKAAILHDLRVPIPGFKANIDHVVVSGKRVLIIDTKVWKPGFYWSLFGANRRGTERIAHTEKDLGYIQQSLITHLRGTGAIVSTPHLAIWSSRKTSDPSIWLLRVPNAKLLRGEALLGFVKGFIGKQAADPIITRKLMELCVKKSKPAAAASFGPRELADDADPFATPAPRFTRPAGGPNPF
ncbi:nuclease-related domain-containing protein [Pseudarthrobacter sp. BIM B-2242]|uniref:nuclease-related domain-containing protein n=1 Tax=Pseudarthrobacter sp. BIM B-2242 TaxID=2772401 RepID=UPI00168AF020|nr:nuclease-related domain-containing protein [Pseudarthrobacter sp. BIM B-2242]QOD06078.1 NERD domain-containing protein [Pseudarthrobacter sp. BIM B-2242]